MMSCRFFEWTVSTSMVVMPMIDVTWNVNPHWCLLLNIWNGPQATLVFWYPWKNLLLCGMYCVHALFKDSRLRQWSDRAWFCNKVHETKWTDSTSVHDLCHESVVGILVLRGVWIQLQWLILHCWTVSQSAVEWRFIDFRSIPWIFYLWELPPDELENS